MEQIKNEYNLGLIHDVNKELTLLTRVICKEHVMHIYTYHIWRNIEHWLIPLDKKKP